MAAAAHRPTRLACTADAARRPQGLIGKTVAAAGLVRWLRPSGEIRRRRYRARNRVDPNEISALFHRAGFETCDFCLGTPWFTFLGLECRPRPQPASETRTTEPTRYKRTPRVIRARWSNVLKTLQRIEFTFDLPCCRRSRRHGRSWSTSFFLRNGPPACALLQRDNVVCWEGSHDYVRPTQRCGRLCGNRLRRRYRIWRAVEP